MRLIKFIIASAISSLPFFTIAQQKKEEIKLIVRADDIGFCHAANEGIIKSYRDGIARSAEIIVPSPWFLEAVKMLNENPGLDVGIHLCLTSEWNNIKWRPVTHASSLADSNGYFYPFLWPNDLFPKNAGNFLLENNPKLDEVEKEFRAQLSLAKKHVKNLTHISAHMGCSDIKPEVKELVKKLAVEYGLLFEAPKIIQFKNFAGKEKNEKQKEEELVNILKSLTPGTYMIVSHPCLDTEETKTIGHPNYLERGTDRAGETYALTSERVKSVIKEKKIKLVSVKEGYLNP